MRKTIDVIQHHMGPPKLTPAASVKTRPAARSGTFAIGGDLPVHRLGYGAMQLTGPGLWGEPADRAQAVAVLRRAVELGVNLIDTADSYGQTRISPTGMRDEPATVGRRAYRVVPITSHRSQGSSRRSIWSAERSP